VAVGLDFAMLWGVLAFLLNYVPNIGSIIAAVPAVLLAMVALEWTGVLLVIAGYVAVNVVFGNILEPRMMGKGLGLSTLVVFLSLVFWGWVLGPGRHAAVRAADDGAQDRARDRPAHALVRRAARPGAP
jgi:AI-2 transport protein TqsA